MSFQMADHAIMKENKIPSDTKMFVCTAQVKIKEITSFAKLKVRKQNWLS